MPSRVRCSECCVLVSNQAAIDFVDRLYRNYFGFHVHETKDVIYQVEVFLTGVDRFNGVFFECPRSHASLRMAVVTRFLVVVPSSECCVLILCPFGLFVWTQYVAVVSSKFAQGVCFHVFCFRRSFPVRSESCLSVTCRKSCSLVDEWDSNVGCGTFKCSEATEDRVTRAVR